MKFSLKYFLFTVAILSATNTFAQVGIGTNTPAASAALEVNSTTNNKGILIPRITAIQKDAISNAVEGLMIYQTSAPTGFYFYTGSSWILLVSQTDLDLKVTKVSGKDLSSNDFTTTEKTKLANIIGTNTGDQDLSALATNTALALKSNSTDVNTSLASKVDKIIGKELSTNDYTTPEKTKLAAIIGINTGDQTNITGNAATATLAASATKLATAKTIGGVSFDGAGNIDLPGVNIAGNQNTTGNAATATKLATARNINGEAFDGSGDITITADAGTLTGNTLKSTVIASSLTSVGTLANLTVTNPIVGSVTGNAGTATKLAASKNINGVAFDGSGDITVTADAGTLSGIVTISNGGTNSTAVATAGGIGYGTGTAHAYTGAGNTGQVLSSNGAGVPTWITPSIGATSLGSISGSNANGGSISSGVLTLTPADQTNGGVVTTGTQSFAGAKTFSGLDVNGFTRISDVLFNGYTFDVSNFYTSFYGYGFDVYSYYATFHNDLNVNGDVYARGTVLTSDRRLKTNIEPIQNSLSTIMKLNPVQYDKKKSLESKEYDKKENGFIAQEIQKVFPFLVKEGTDKDKILSVDYNSIIPVLTKGIQEQQLQIDELKKIIQELINKK